MTDEVGTCGGYEVASIESELHELPYNITHVHVRNPISDEEECYHRYRYNMDRSFGGWVSSRSTIGVETYLSFKVVVGPWVRIERSVLDGEIWLHGSKDSWTTVQNSHISGFHIFEGSRAIDGGQFVNDGQRRVHEAVSGPAPIDDHQEPETTGTPPWQQ